MFEISGNIWVLFQKAVEIKFGSFFFVRWWNFSSWHPLNSEALLFIDYLQGKTKSALVLQH